MPTISRACRSSSTAPTPPNSRSAFMSTYSLSDGLASGAPRLSRAPLLASWIRESGVGVLASAAWIAFGLSCLWWEDVADWSRTHSLGIAAFIVAAVALFGTVGADYLGSAGRGPHVPLELARLDLPDRARNRLSGHRADLVGRRERQQRLLRRRTHAGRKAVLPGAEGRDPRGIAACLRRPVHGARLVLRRAG